MQGKINKHKKRKMAKEVSENWRREARGTYPNEQRRRQAL